MPAVAARADSDDASPIHARDEEVGTLGWRSFVERVHQRRPDLASVLEQGMLVSFAADGVQVAYTPGTFFWDAANDKDHKALFSQLLAQHMRCDSVPFVVVQKQAGEAPRGMASLASQRQEEQKSGWQQTQQEARSHAHVQAAVQIFGGEVRAIEPVDTDKD